MINSDKLIDEKINEVMTSIQKALNPNDEDAEQKSLIDAIQQHRTLILDISSLAFSKKPGDPKLLEAISSLLAQMEKSVRDNRKESQKKKDAEDNKVSFRQMVDALQSLSSGDIILPTFSNNRVFLDPNVSLTQVAPDLGKIKDAEIEMGQQMLDFDGQPVKGL